ncbi:MAG: enoyl-CoA hydratase/isomerase family protein [Myxococcota bacterium]
MDRFAHLKVTIEDGGRRWTLELDHGKANEIGSAQLVELETLAAALEADPLVVSLITFSRRKTSKGTPIFVAGANVTERVGWEPDRVKAHVAWQRSVLARLRRAPVLHVAVVDGIALGWGTEFLLTADWRIAADGAVFGLPETGLGILPGAGGTSELWTEIGVGHALRLGMTGERVGADEALRIGLVHERVPTVDAGLARAIGLCELAARKSPTAIARFKRGVLASVGQTAEERTEIEARAYAACVDAGEAAIGRENFDAIAAGRTPPWGPRRTED